MKVKTLNVDLKWTHVGQYRPYGDTHRVCEIHTTQELSEKDILDVVKHGNKLRKDIWEGKDLSIGEYFTGYYTIEKTKYGYKYEGVEPYTD